VVKATSQGDAPVVQAAKALLESAEESDSVSSVRNSA